jgi:predicted ABC-type ATPase
MLGRLDRLAAQRRNFAFETTMASRTFALRIARWMETGYGFHLVFLWLPNAEFALARVQERVRAGGHDVPEATVRRRYARGLINFFALYRSMATTWRLYDNSRARPRIVARGDRTGRSAVSDVGLWKRITEASHGA